MDVICEFVFRPRPPLTSPPSLPFQVLHLLEGIPHSLVLSNDNRELAVNVRVARPAINSAPFTTELVLDRLTDAGADWRKKCKVRPRWQTAWGCRVSELCGSAR